MTKQTKDKPKIKKTSKKDFLKATKRVLKKYKNTFKKLRENGD